MCKAEESEEFMGAEGIKRRDFQLADSQVAFGAWIKGRASSLALNQELQQSLAVHCGCNLQSSAGFLPTEYNTADGPSRNKPVARPMLPPPQLFFLA